MVISLYISILSLFSLSLILPFTPTPSRDSKQPFLAPYACEGGGERVKGENVTQLFPTGQASGAVGDMPPDAEHDPLIGSAIRMSSNICAAMLLLPFTSWNITACPSPARKKARSTSAHLAA